MYVPQIRDAKCDECGKCFFEKADLQKHMRVHTKDRPFKCDLCPMSFAQQNILKCHRRRHTGEKPYVCDICDRAFTQVNTDLLVVSYYCKRGNFCLGVIFAFFTLLSSL